MCPLLVGLSGPACSGKSTLARRLGSWPGWVAVEEVAQEVFREGFARYGTLDDLRRDPDGYLGFQLAYLWHHLEREDEALATGMNVVTDRTVFDCLMYSRLYLPEGHLRIFEEAFRRAPVRYDLIVLCAPVPPREDGFRAVADLRDPAGQLDELAGILSGCWKGEILLLPSLPVEQREAAVLNALSGLRGRGGRRGSNP